MASPEFAPSCSFPKMNPEEEEKEETLPIHLPMTWKPLSNRVVSVKLRMEPLCGGVSRPG